MTNIAILGAGGYARVIADTLRLSGRPPLGYVNRQPVPDFGGLSYLGTDDDMLAQSPAGMMLANGIGAIDVPHLRRKVFDRFKTAGFAFIQVIHPAAQIGGDVGLGEGAQVLAGTAIQTGANIGRNTIVNVGVVVDHDCVVGDHVHLATGAVLAGGVRVGDAALIGAGATVIQSIRIGSQALVAAGATVVRDVGDGERVAGVPAKSLSKAV